MSGLPFYFHQLREGFMTKCREMGLDHYAVQDFLEQRGICEAQHNIVLD